MTASCDNLKSKVTSFASRVFGDSLCQKAKCFSLQLCLGLPSHHRLFFFCEFRTISDKHCHPHEGHRLHLGTPRRSYTCQSLGALGSLSTQIDEVQRGEGMCGGSTVQRVQPHIRMERVIGTPHAVFEKFLFSTLRASRCCVDLLRVHRDNNPDQLFGVGALVHRGLHPVRGLVREVPLAFPALHHSAREGCPGHCDTPFTGQISSRLARLTSSLKAARSFQSG